jgi:aspartyl aminopeptidase
VNTAGKYYMTRNRSALLAFVIGGAYKPGNGCAVVGAHTDSPVLRVKPVSKISGEFMQLAACSMLMSTGSGTLQVGVSCYGGGLWRTWFDRDLSVAGRVYVRSHPAGTDGRITQHLVRVNTPLLYIPNLCIHLDTERDKPWPFNKEDHLRPILATEAMDKLNVRAVVDGVESTGVQRDHHSALVNIIAKHVKCSVEDIVDFELCLYDTQPAVGERRRRLYCCDRRPSVVSTRSLLPVRVWTIWSERTRPSLV